MTVSEFYDLYCFFNEQIRLQSELLKHRTRLYKNILQLKKSLEQQRDKIVDNFRYDFIRRLSEYPVDVLSREGQCLLKVLLEYPELCQGIEDELLAYFEYVARVVKKDSSLRQILPLFSELLSGDFMSSYIATHYKTKRNVFVFCDWLKHCRIDDSVGFYYSGVQANMDKILEKTAVV